MANTAGAAIWLGAAKGEERVIVFDSSVWIDFLNGRNRPHVHRLRAMLGSDEIIVGDLMRVSADVLIPPPKHRRAAKRAAA